jgi:tetratricopeptide (TPR) repeat protein
LGQTLKAIPYFKEQLIIAQTLGNFEEVCGLLANLGDAYAISGDVDSAKNFYEEQRTLAELKNLPAYIGSSYNGLGYVWVKKGKIDQAIDCYLRALENYKELNDHDKQLELQVGIGLNYRKLEQWENSIVYLEQALEVAKYTENRKEEIHIRVDLAESYFKLEKQDLAFAQIDKAAEHLKIIQVSWSAPLLRRIELLRNFYKPS